MLSGMNQFSLSLAGRLSLFSLSLMLGTTPALGQEVSAVSQVKLGYQGDPASSVSVSWREPQTAAGGVVQFLEGERADFSTCTAPCLEVAASPTTLTTQDAGTFTFLRAQLSALKPNTLYSYRAGDGSNWSPVYRFRTAPTSGSFSVAFGGELHIGDKFQPGWKAMAETIMKAHPTFMMSAGDNINTGALESEWARFFDQSPAFFGTVPFMSAVGNHETYGKDANGNDVQGNPNLLYFANFSMPKNGADDSGRSYSFDMNGVHFVSLEANPSTALDNVQKQAEWLKRDLAQAAGRTRFQIVTMHAPLLHSRLSRTEQPKLNIKYENPEFPELLMPIFDQYGVDLVVAGHDKAYVRSLPMVGQSAPDKTPKISVQTVPNGQGTVYVQLSTGGDKYPDFFYQDWMAVGRVDLSEYLLVNIEQDRLNIQANQADGKVVDSFIVMPRAAK